MRATKAQVKARVEEVLRIRLDGAEAWDLREYVREKVATNDPVWGDQPLSDATLIVSRICSGTWHTPQVPALILLLVGVVWLYQFLFESRLKSVLEANATRIAVAVCMIVYLCLFATEGGTFIYFQF